MDNEKIPCFGNWLKSGDRGGRDLWGCWSVLKLDR